MGENIPIFLVNESEYGQTSEIEIFSATIDIYGRPFRICIGATAGSAKLSDIVPLAWSLADEIYSAVIRYLTERGQYVPCQKGCSSCCKYLVALSIPEIFYIQEYLAKINVNSRKQFMQSCFNAAQRILDIELLDKYDIRRELDDSQLSLWYRELNLQCPFNSENICRIYAHRPLACREHMVTTSPAFCEDTSTNIPEVVTMPLSILEALGRFAADLEQTTTEAIILPLALLCKGDDYIQRSERRRPAKFMAERFIHILKTMSREAIEGSSAINRSTYCSTP